MEFKEILKTLRKKSKLTQSELGKKIGKTDAAINHWESGRNLPENETLLKLTEIFDVTFETLMGYDDQTTSTTQSPALSLEGLTNDQINALKEFAEFLRSKNNA